MVTAMAKFESSQDKAVRLLNAQLKELQTVRDLSGADPAFTAWFDTTASILKRFLSPTAPYLERFVEIPFVSQIGNQRPIFAAGCRTADATIRAALREIQEFGVHIGRDEPVGKDRTGGVHQTFHGPVTIQTQAIATDNAIQRINHAGDMGGDFGAMLKDIAAIYQQSEELRGREIKEGLAAIEGLASEAQKDPRQRNWKSMIESGEKVLDISAKASDLAQKLAPYTLTIIGMVKKAKHMLGLT